MRARATRSVSVTASATQLRDTAALPVTHSVYRYASGGASIQIGPSGVTYGTGQAIAADADYVDLDQSLNRYAIASAAGPTTVFVTDYEA